MSSINRLTLTFTDRDAIRRAVVRCNGEIVLDMLDAAQSAKQGKKPFEISRYQKVKPDTIDLAFRLPQRNYPFVIQNDGTLITETSNGIHDESADLINFNHEYTLAVTEKYCNAQGWSCEETVAEDGTKLIAVLTA